MFFECVWRKKIFQLTKKKFEEERIEMSFFFFLIIEKFEYIFDYYAYIISQV